MPIGRTPIIDLDNHLVDDLPSWGAMDRAGVEVSTPEENARGSRRAAPDIGGGSRYDGQRDSQPARQEAELGGDFGPYT